MAPGSDVAVSTGSLPTAAVCDARVCGCARQGPARRESPPSPSEDPGQARLQPSGVRAALPVLCLPVAVS